MTDTTEPKPNKRAAAKARTRARILEASKALLESGGYEAMTIRAIAGAAGMSTGAVFANWKDKADLYVDLVGHPPIDPDLGLELAQELAAAAETFRDYERLHLAKSPPDTAKAETNARHAARAEQVLGRIKSAAVAQG